jgi:hypothetical protein
MTTIQLCFVQAQTINPEAYKNIIAKKDKDRPDILNYELSFSIEYAVKMEPGMIMNDESKSLKARLKDFEARVCGCVLYAKFGRKKWIEQLKTVPQIILDNKLAIMKEPVNHYYDYKV